MNPSLSQARQVLTEQVLDATTLEEVAVARQKLRDWIAARPEEREWVRDGFEQLAQMEEITCGQLSEHSDTVGAR